MALTAALESWTRRWTRVEYERPSELGIFQPGERLELLDGLLIVRGPQSSWQYGRREIVRAPDVVAPLIAPDSPIPVADLLP